MADERMTDGWNVQVLGTTEDGTEIALARFVPDEDRIGPVIDDALDILKLGWRPNGSHRDVADPGERMMPAWKVAEAPPAWTQIRTEFTETREAPTGPSILSAWQRGWRPGDATLSMTPPVETSELERDRAEQLVAALAVALRGNKVLAWYRDPETVARNLLAHPYVRDALEPAKAVVWAEPLGTIVSFSYPDSETPVKASHVRVRLDPGVVVSADTIGKKVAVAQ